MTRLEAFAAALVREIVETRERVARAGMVDLATYDASDDGPRYTEGNAAARALCERELRQFVRDGFTWATDGCGEGNDWLDQTHDDGTRSRWDRG